MPGRWRSLSIREAETGAEAERAPLGRGRPRTPSKTALTRPGMHRAPAAVRQGDTTISVTRIAE